MVAAVVYAGASAISAAGAASASGTVGAGTIASTIADVGAVASLLPKPKPGVIVDPGSADAAGAAGGKKNATPWILLVGVLLAKILIFT